MPTTTLNAQISALTLQVASDIKSLIANIGSLSDLTTQQKASLVVALNEVKASIGSLINDSSTDSVSTWSGSKIQQAISTAVSNLVNGAPETLDTLNELASAISENVDAIDALEAIAAGHVKYDAAQSITDEQKTQARTNIGAASAADVASLQTSIGKIGDLASLTTTAKNTIVAAINEVRSSAASAVTTATSAQETAESAQSSVNTLSANIGATDTDFKALYVAARDGTS